MVELQRCLTTCATINSIEALMERHIYPHSRTSAPPARHLSRPKDQRQQEEFANRVSSVSGRVEVETLVALEG